jgi:hypothetical protein
MGPVLGPFIPGKNAALEMGPVLGPFILGKNAAQSSPLMTWPDTPPGSCSQGRAPVPKSAVRSVKVVIRSPRFDFAPRV